VTTGNYTFQLECLDGKKFIPLDCMENDAILLMGKENTAYNSVTSHRQKVD
jgi:hypothetical protein